MYDNLRGYFDRLYVPNGRMQHFMQPTVSQPVCVQSERANARHVHRSTDHVDNHDLDDDGDAVHGQHVLLLVLSKRCQLFTQQCRLDVSIAVFHNSVHPSMPNSILCLVSVPVLLGSVAWHLHESNQWRHALQMQLLYCHRLFQLRHQRQRRLFIL